MKTIVSILCAVAISATAFCQSTAGSLKGSILDEKSNEPIPSAKVKVEVGGSELITGTDPDGKFTIKPLNPGTYIVEISMTGYQTIKHEFVVKPDQITFLNDLVMGEADSLLGDVLITAYAEPLIDPEETSKISMGMKEIRQSAVLRDPKKLISSMSSDIKLGLDGELYFRGSRSDGVIQFVDGVKVGSTIQTVPGRAIGRVSVYTGGVPAKYGDTTSGVVVMETISYFDLYNAKMAELNNK